MQFYGALVLFVTLSAACGLSCYVWMDKSYSDKITCPAMFDRCATTTVNNVVIKSCMSNNTCVGPIVCCDTDLCNGAIPTGSSVLLLLVSSAILTLFH